MELVGGGLVVRPASSVGGRLAPKWAGRGIHFCECLQGLEPVWRIVVLKRVQTVATRGCDPYRGQSNGTLRCNI